MTVKAKCRNILRYDKETAQYIYCNFVVSVDSDQIGTTVQCPDCGAAVEVLPPEPQQIEADPLDALDEVVTESTQNEWTYETPLEIKPQHVRTQLPCINCHTPIPVSSRHCPECGYEQPDDESEGPTGFQLWTRSWLADDASPLMIIGIGSAFFCVFAMLCLSFTVIQYGPGPAVCMLSPFALILAMATLVLLAGRKPREPLGTAARRLFNPMSLMLVLCRASSWREPRWPFRARRLLDRRDTPLNDQTLLDDEQLDDYEALDLEGTQISDTGLDYLLTAKSLRFVVVRRTRTTPKGVRRLQNRRPHLWIWA